MPLGVDSTFAGYTIVRLLGAGRMGEVYLAQHPRLPRTEALKVLATEVSTDPIFRERFLREADLASTLWHPHIVGMHDRGAYQGQLWIAMDFVDGEDADSLLDRRYPTGMPLELVTAIVTAVASALDYGHGQGLLHRDIKPANILLTDEDDEAQRRILLTDFGIAGTTVAYPAPEQLIGHDIDGRADQYALAATAYHLLTGTRLGTQNAALAATRPELAPLDPVLATALAQDPSRRFASCDDFARVLPAPPPVDQVAVEIPNSPGRAGAYAAPRGNAGRGWQPVPAAPPARGASRPPPWAWIVGIGAVALVVIAALLIPWALRKGSSPDSESTPEIAAGATDSTTRSPPSTPVAPPAPPQQRVTAVIVGTCDEGGSCGVKQRTGPYIAAPRLYPNDLQDGMTVTVACQTTGESRSSMGHGSSIVWYRLDNGAYVNSVYMNISASGIPAC